MWWRRSFWRWRPERIWREFVGIWTNRYRMCEFSIVMQTRSSKTYMNWTSIWTPSFLSDICTRIYIIVNIGRDILWQTRASRDTDSNHTAKNPGSDLYSLSKKRHWGLCEYIGRSGRRTLWREFRSITDAERWRWRQMPSLTRRTTVFRGTQAGLSDSGNTYELRIGSWPCLFTTLTSWKEPVIMDFYASHAEKLKDRWRRWKLSHISRWRSTTLCT
jgi:hypothetical protein